MGRLSGLVAGVLVLLLLLLPAVPAGAHTGAPGVRNVIDAHPPRLDASIRTTAADEIVMVAHTSVEVLAPTGEPFLRFTPDRVDANLNSVAWYASESLSFNPITSVAGVGPGPPRWVQVSDTGSWAWFDPRLRPDQPADQAAAAQPAHPLTLARWTIPLSSGVIAGHRVYEPVRGALEDRLASDAPPLPGVKVAVIGGPGSNAPAVFVDNESSAVVTILGAAGEPLLRISPTATDANAASPSWLLTAASRAEAPTGLVSAHAPPRWFRVANQHSFSWLDDRGRSSWNLPLSADGRTVKVRILVSFQTLPSVGGAGGRPLGHRVLDGVAAGLVVGVVWLLWRQVRYDH